MRFKYGRCSSKRFGKFAREINRAEFNQASDNVQNSESLSAAKLKTNLRFREIGLTNKSTAVLLTVPARPRLCDSRL